MEHKSIWESFKEQNTKEIIKKTEDINTDILIIGAGITGLTTAYFLKDTNKKVTIIDKSFVGMGITSKTTAKITYLQQDIYSKLTKMHNKEIAKKYYESQKEAINTINKIIKDNNIKCDLEKVSSIIFTNKEKNLSKLEKEKNILTSYGEKIKDYQDEFIKYGLIVDNTYTFNPLKYLNSLRKIVESKISIYENTIATNITKIDNTYIVSTNNGNINTEQIVIACHYPFFIIPHLFPLKTYIEREYVNAAKVDNSKNRTAINIDNNLYSLRYYKDYLIYGSNNHRLTSKIDYQKNYQKSREEFIKYFKKEPQYSWMNQDIISNDKIPFIGTLKDDLYISTAYNTWGMTNATIGGKIISDIIIEKENKYISLFNPNRINIPLIINSFIGIFHYLKVYIEGLLRKSNPYYIKINNIIYGIYTDSRGIKHKIKLICPHMKCSLVFNKEEETWDCPCHGSRFDLDGNILETPTIKKI